MVNLRELAENFCELEASDAAAMREAADKAEQFAFDVDSLVDGKDDELGELLSPVVEFLRGLAGIVKKDEPAAG